MNRESPTMSRIDWITAQFVDRAKKLREPIVFEIRADGDRWFFVRFQDQRIFEMEITSIVNRWGFARPHGVVGMR